MGTYSNGYDNVALPNHAILSIEEREMLIALEQETQLYHVVTNRTGIHPDILRMLVRYEVIPGGPESCDLNAAQEVADQLAAACAPVEGRGIGIREAMQKYGFSNSIIHKWHQEGWVKVVGMADKYNARLYNEGDLAFAKKLSDLIGRVKGRAIFPAKPRSGRPRKRRL